MREHHHHNNSFCSQRHRKQRQPSAQEAIAFPPLSHQSDPTIVSDRCTVCVLLLSSNISHSHSIVVTVRRGTRTTHSSQLPAYSSELALSILFLVTHSFLHPFFDPSDCDDHSSALCSELVSGDCGTGSPALQSESGLIPAADFVRTIPDTQSERTASARS